MKKKAMKYEIIFYHSGRTAAAERLLGKRLGILGAECVRTAAAVTPEEMAQMLERSLREADLIFVIGGLDGGAQSTDRILSLILSAKAGSLHSEKLRDEDDHIAYRLWADKQNLVILPDDPEVMEIMLSGHLLRKLRQEYDLKQEVPETPSFDSVAKELQEQLSAGKGDRVFMGNPAMLQEKKALRIQKWVSLVLLAVGLLLTAASVWFWLN